VVPERFYSQDRRSAWSRAKMLRKLGPVHVMKYAGHVDDQAIRSLVTRLARAHPSGGRVIERAAIVAEGGNSRAVVTWIIDHGGTPEAMAATSRRRGLHGALLHAGGGSEPRAPSRYVLPAGALD
jgi:hypothetical protein